MDVLYQEQPTAFQLMVKPIGPICNLKCTYCYYLEKENLYDNKAKAHFRMQDDVLEEFIKQQISSHEVPVVSFVWQGGEPTLLEIDYYRNALKIQQKYAGKKKIENVLQTNGTLLNDEWCKFLYDNQFLVGISIDGPEHIHNQHRKTINGEATFSKVMKGIELLKKHRVEFNTLTVVNNNNSYNAIEIYQFLKRIGSGYMQFIPIVERLAQQPTNDKLQLVSPDFEEKALVTEWSVDALQYGNFLCEIFDEWIQTDVGEYFIQIFDVALAAQYGHPPGLCVFSETCGEALALEHNGDLYSCDHFVYNENFLGNIMDKSIVSMIKSAKQIKFGIDKMDKLPEQCKKCDVKYACHGGCPKNRIISTQQGEKGLNYLCLAYKKFFKHVEPYMKFMANELRHKRPPANVMKWIHEQKLEKAEKENTVKKEKKKLNHNKISRQKIGKNELCPCGSGKLYKNCCRNK